MSIQEALVLMIDALKNMKKAEKDVLLTLLFQYVENVTHNFDLYLSVFIRYTHTGL